MGELVWEIFVSWPHCCNSIATTGDANVSTVAVAGISAAWTLVWYVAKMVLTSLLPHVDTDCRRRPELPVHKVALGSVNPPAVLAP
eukprot:1644736-Prymnesium_polylepis.1